MAGNTAREALLAEILGDVLKLHDAVTGLEARIPELLRGLESRITDYQESLDSSYSELLHGLDKSSGEIRGAVELFRSEIADVRQTLVADIRSAVKGEVQGIAAEVVESATSEIRRALESKIRNKEGSESKWGRASMWLTAGAASFALLLGVMAGRTWGPVRDLSPEEARYIEAGQDILEVIPRLPGDVRKRLEAALEDLRKAK
jgi:hypothetical protein